MTKAGLEGEARLEGHDQLVNQPLRVRHPHPLQDPHLPWLRASLGQRRKQTSRPHHPGGGEPGGQS